MRLSRITCGILAALAAAAGASASRTVASAEAEPGEVLRLLEARQYDQAEALGRQRLVAAEARSGPDSLDTANALDDLVEVLAFRKQGVDPEPVALARRAVAIKEEALGPNHVELARSLHNLGTVLATAGDRRAARALHERALAIRERALGPDHPDVAESLDYILETLVHWYSLGPELHKERERWLAMARRAVGIKEDLLGPDDPSLAKSLHHLGYLLWSRGDLQGSNAAHERALAVREKALDPEHPDLASSLVYVAFSRWALRGDLAGSNALGERALAIRERSLPPNHPDVALSLDEQGAGHQMSARYDKALQMHTRALAIRNKALGAQSAEYAWNLSNIGRVHYWLGDYARAAHVLERAGSIAREALGAEDGIAASIELTRAIVIFNAGDWAQALTVYQRNRRVLEKALGPKFYTDSSASAYEAWMLHRAGNLESARALLERTLEALEATLGPRHLRVGHILHLLASLEMDSGNSDRAASAAERAVQIFETSQGAYPHYLASSLEVLGRVHRARRDSVRALEMLARAVAIRERAVGAGHPDLAHPLGEQARLFRECGEYSSSLEAALRAEEISRRHLLLSLSVLPEHQALRYARARINGLDVALSIMADPGSIVSSERVWDAVVRGRALVFDEMAGRHGSVADSHDLEIAALSKNLELARTRLANIAFRGPGESSAEQYRSLLEQATREKEDTERVLAQRSSAYRERLWREDVGFDKVAAALPPGSALIAYARYQNVSPGPADPDSCRTGDGGQPTQGTVKPTHTSATAHGLNSAYLAFVLKDRDTVPLVVPLGPADAIDALIGEWMREVKTPPLGSTKARARSEARYRRAGDLLRQKIWDPIAPHLWGAAQVFLVPDGLLHLVSFAALPSSAGGYLVDENLTLHYLSTEKDLITPSPPSQAGRGVLIVGGPDFDADPRRLTAPSGPAPPGLLAQAAAPTPTSESFYRSPRAACAELGSLRFSPIPGARLEAEQVASQWSRAGQNARTPQPQVLRLSGSEAGEAAFKRLASGQSIVHIATHGFFAHDRCRSSLDELYSADTGPPLARRPDSPGADNPLILSGLALAGANRRHELDPSENVEDGILTAEELASLDLSEAQLVVLSACETASGKLQAGEGVLGLRRALAIAGARTAVMSLWPVQDEATREWMVEFYRSRLSGGSTADSVRRAALAIKKARGHAGKDTHPFYWAAFVASGDWR